MTSSTIEKLKELQAEILEEDQKREQQQAEKAALRANPDEQARQSASKLLSRVYKALSDKIYASCGLEDSIELFLSSHELRFAFGALGAAIRKVFQESCGLHISSENCVNDCYLKLDLSGKAKICEGVDEEEKLTTLDYPALLDENRRRRKCWEENLPVLAKQVINITKECLEVMPNKHYGVKQTLPIWQHCISEGQEQIRNPFDDGEFSVGDIVVKWNNLTAHQFSDLTEEMNKVFSGGRISIELFSGRAYVTVTRQPERKIENPYYNYWEFYSMYDRVTPELQAVFDMIADDVCFPTAAAQVRCLAPQRKLIFQSWRKDKLDYNTLETIKDEIHEQHLITSLNKKLRGIRVTDMKFRYDTREVKISEFSYHTRTEYINHRVEFEVEIDETSDNPLVQGQLKLEKAIEDIKEQQVPYIADQLIDMVVSNVRVRRRCGDCSRKGYLGKGREFFTMKLEEVVSKQLKEAVGGIWCNVEIDMRKVNQDEAFAWRLEEAVEQQSGGMVKLDAKDYSYELRFSEDP